jgi:hypothetical protein
MFDRNPKTTPADRFIAGKTTDAIVAAIAGALRVSAPTVTTDVTVADAILALDARFTRKAERRAAALDAE